MKEQAENGCVPVEGSETTRVLGSGCHWRVHLQQQRRPRSVLATRAGGEGGGDRNRQRSALCAARLRHRSGQRSSSLHPRESGAGNTHRQRIVGSARGRQGALGGECALLRRGLRGLAQASELRHPLLCLERGACATAGEDREKSRQEPVQVELTGPHDDRQQRVRRVMDVCCVVEAAAVGSGRELAALRAPVVRLHLIDEMILRARHRTPSLRPARHSPSTEPLCPTSATVVGGWLTAGA